jgi:hypothetical protein
MAVIFADAERKDLLQMKEAADDILPFLVVNGFDHASMMRCTYLILRRSMRSDMSIDIKVASLCFSYSQR